MFLGFAGGFLYRERVSMDGITVEVLAGVVGAATRIAGEVRWAPVVARGAIRPSVSVKCKN